VKVRARAICGGALLLISVMGLRAQHSADSVQGAPGSAARARDTAAIPPRPKLDSAADTNSAQANYVYAMKMVSENPEEAVRGFYWASRIDPSSGDALYGLRTAKLLAMTDQDLAAYFGYGHGKRTPEQLALDSLIYRAYTINPFLFSSIDGVLVRRTIEAEIAAMYPSIAPELLAQSVARRMRAASGEPWLAYTEGRFQDALDTYAKVLADTLPRAQRSTKKKLNAKEQSHAEMRKVRRDFAAIETHAQRARIFYLLHELDSAGTEMTTALSLLRAEDSGGVVVLYQSKAIFEQSLGMIYEHERHPDLAREAYGRALQEDLSYYAAHSRLAQLELAQGDTSEALSEMDLAVQLQPVDPVLRYRFAEVLVYARRDADAVQQLKKAIDLDPYYGPPHLLLATIGDVESYTSDAIAEYQRYLALAARSDPQLPRVKMRLAKLTASLASSQSHP
jgi:tetratricopeptide (TPR) repeat protein